MSQDKNIPAQRGKSVRDENNERSRWATTDYHRVKMITYMNALKDRSELIQRLDELILESLTTDEEIVNEIMSSSDYHTKIQERIIALTEALERFTADEEASLNAVSPNERTIVNQDHARLPKFQLKSFSRDVLSYQEFWETYNSAVHSNENLDNVTKFSYLRGLLEDQAASSISWLSLSSENYEEAVQLLQARYGNKQIFISAHIDKLLGLPNVYSSSDTSKLREIYI